MRIVGTLLAAALGSAASAQEVEIVATSHTLEAPEANGAIVVSTGGVGIRAALAPDALRSNLEEYLAAAGYRAVNLVSRDRGERSAARLRSAVPYDGHISVETNGMKFAFVALEGRKTPEGFVHVLLSEDDPVEVADRMRTHPEIRLAFVGGLTSFAGDAIRVAEGQYVVLVPRRGAVRAKAKFEGARLVSVATAAEPFPEEPPAAVRAFCKERGISVRPLRDTLRNARDVKEMGPASLLKVEREQTYPLELSARNRVVGLRIWSLALRSEYGACRDVAVLDLEWENAMPVELAFERKGDASHAMPSLDESLFLVVNRRRLASLHPDAANSDGHVPTKNVKLERIGSTLRGNVLFALPSEPVEELELRFLDPAYGPIVLPIHTRSDRTEERALTPLQKNESVELGVYGVRKLPEWGGKKAPEGSVFLAVDLRGRSIGKGPVDWRTSIHAAADGKDATDVGVPSSLRFLPDATTGEVLVFLVPRSASSAELRAGALRFALDLR